MQQDRKGAGKAADLAPQIVNVELVNGLPVFRIGTRALNSKSDLTEFLKTLPHEAGVFVRGSNLAPVHAIAAVLQATKDAGFTKVTYVPTN